MNKQEIIKMLEEELNSLKMVKQVNVLNIKTNTIIETFEEMIRKAKGINENTLWQK